MFVTGASGFVGRSLCVALRTAGHDVCALVRVRTPAAARERIEALGVRCVVGDLGDEESLALAVRGSETVFHLAALRPRGAAEKDYERVNLIGTENLIDAARRARVRRLVYLSDARVTAGNYHRDYVDESFPQPDRFLDPYSRSKALAEDLAIGTSGTAGMDGVALRPGLVWGADDSVLLPELIRRRRDGTLALLSGGTRFAPTTQIDNLVAALMLAAEKPGIGGNVYYVTDDERVTMRAFLGMLLRAAGVGPPRRRMPYPIAYARAFLTDKRAGTDGCARADVIQFGRAAFFNIKRARAELGYAPTVSLREGERSLTDWARAVGGADRIVAGDVLQVPSDGAEWPRVASEREGGPAAR